MPKQSRALLNLTPATLGALETLGSHLALARMRRKESLATRAVRVGVSVPTLMKMEQGDPTVSLGAYAQALWLIGRDGELARVAAPEFDREAIERDVDQAIALGRQRSRTARAGRGAAPVPKTRKAGHGG
jgi:hypothetical protein